ncbi:MAG: hypothetical protein IJ718_01545 [Paludibacteraceae bacterium]|nr:hypothetical protein [Paludibacteraceae bacterium]
MKHPQVNKISFQSSEAQPYIDKAATELREKTIAMLCESSEGTEISFKAVNAYIKNTFEECDFLFAMFVEKNKHKHGWLMLGVSVMTSLMPLEITNYIICRPKKEQVEYIEQEYSTGQCARDLKEMMKSLYNEIKTKFKDEL